MKNVLWNAIGIGLPLLIGLILTPTLINTMGAVVFGYLTLAWVFVGYFSIFDLGLARSLTKTVAEQLALGNKKSAAEYVTTGVITALLISTLAAIALSPFTRQIAALATSGRDANVSEFQQSILFLLWTLPAVTGSACLVGILEAHSSFKWINITRAVVGAASYIAPVIAYKATQSFTQVVIALCATRIVGLCIYAIVCHRSQVWSEGQSLFDIEKLRKLFSFGIWVLVSNLLAPILSQLDRILISKLCGVAALPTYSVPNDLITRLGFVTEIYYRAAFPKYVQATQSTDHGYSQYLRSAVMITGICSIAFISAWFATPTLLALWLKEANSPQMSTVAQVMLAGLFWNSIAKAPFLFLQAAGKSKVTATCHLIEAPIYIGALVVTLPAHGLLAGAFIWSLRMLADLLLLVGVIGSAKIFNEHQNRTREFSAIGFAALMPFALLWQAW